MRLFFLVFFAFCIPLFSLAQVQDDFSDGDFTNNPTWSGDDIKFKISSSKQLQLNSTGTDTSYLSTPNALLDKTEWRFYIKQSFNSSSNNHSRIYLVSDQLDLKASLNGYFVQFGSTQDDICLYRQDGINITKIISGVYGFTGNSLNAFTIKVTRDQVGNWELFSDDQAGSNFHLEGSVLDNTYQTTASFGLWCKYTSSNSTKVYFDDVYVGNIVVDSIPPVLLSVKTLSNKTIDLLFNEALDPISATNTTNYSVDNGIGQPTSATMDAIDPSIIHLNFSNSFSQGVLNAITVSNIKDEVGNITQPQSEDFLWYEVQLYDIVFNEVMADPAPVVGLPDAEYIEIFNNTNLPISLVNWTIEIGTNLKILPDTVIQPKGYVIIGHQNAEFDLSPYGAFIGLSSFSLTNSGQQLILKDENGSVIHQVKYSDIWYADNNKSDGGWALEQVDPMNPCGCESNWRASVSNSGGSPGEVNSIYQLNKDQTAPIAIRVSVINPVQIQVYFSEPMDSNSLIYLNQYEVADGFGFPISIQGNYPSYTNVTLLFNQPLQVKQEYSICLKDSFRDCVGNMMKSNSCLKFGVPEAVDSGDVVINEVLFNPHSPGVDYIEIYNLSDKILDLKSMRLANWSEEDNNFDNVKELSEDSYLIFPHTHYVFSTNSNIVEKQYFVQFPDNMIEIPSMPSMSNSEGNVVLLSSSLKLIDRLDYDEDMQYALIQDPKGVSLERLNYERSSYDRENWHSAASTGDNYSQSSDYAGTPTAKNSQYISNDGFNGEISFQPETFSPDNDGYDDVLNINYQFNDAGYTANIMIYDSKGKLIRRLVSNELLSSKGTITWDGLDNQSQKAKIGMYIILIEVFNLEGVVNNYKKTVVVAGRLN